MTAVFCCFTAKNFKEDQPNFRRFPVFAGKISKSWRLPAFPRVEDTLLSQPS